MQPTGENKTTERFAANLAANRARVFAYVLTRVGANQTLAEDVTQDCFVQVWKARENNPPPSGALYSYLVKTARNILRDRHRRQMAMPTTDLSDVSAREPSTPEKEFVLRETMERIAAQIALMPHILRETLLLRMIEGYDYPAIADRMNCPVGTIKSRLNAARAYLRHALAEQEQIPSTSRIQTTRTSIQREINTTYRENKTMTNDNPSDPLRQQVEAMEERLRALEKNTTRVTSASDVWKAPTTALIQSLNQDRKEKNSVFALGLVHMITQVADRGIEGTASGINTLTSATSLPNDQDLTKRMERMRALTADLAVLSVFRYFYAMRFDNKEMRASIAELAEATGENTEKITTLLQPLVADRTLLLVSDGSGKETYEWDGNDPAITTLLFATT